MAITVLQQEKVNDGSGQTCSGTVPAISAGTNRLVLIVSAYGAVNSANTVSTATLGAASITPAFTMNEVTGLNPNSCLFFGYIKDADIPSGENPLTITWTGSGSVIDAYIIVFEGVDQSAPILSSAGDGAANTSPAAFSLGALSAGDAVFCIGADTTTADALTLPTGYTATSTTSLENTSWRAEMAYKLLASASTETITFSDFTGPRAGQAGVAIKSAATGLSITSIVPSQIDDGESFTINGTGFGASQGLSLVQIGGVTQPVTSWGPSQIVCTATRGSQSMGNATLTIYKM